MTKFQKPVAWFVASCLLAIGIPVAHADPITFATATLNTVPSDAFAFTNSGAASTLQTRDPWAPHTLGTAVPVTFEYAVPNGYGPALANIDATMTLSAIVSGTAISQDIPFVGTAIIQPIADLTITINANTPVHGKTTLLTLRNSTGMISGLQGGGTATVTGDVGTGDSVNYASDFLPLTDATQQNYGFSFALITPSYNWDQHYLNTMTLSGADWTFSADSAPEPATLGLVVLPGAALLLRRRTR